MSLGENKRMKESKQKMRAKEKKIDKLNRLLSYLTSNIALLFGISLALEIVTYWSLWTNVFYNLFLMIPCLVVMNSYRKQK